MLKRSISLAVVFLAAWACSPAPAHVSVKLAPDAASVHVGHSIQFTVTTSPASAVTWSLSGSGGSGAACGTISSTGLYTAPATVPGSGVVTVKATSVDDPSGSASATITIFPAVEVTVAPPHPIAAIGSTQPFTVTVDNTIGDDRVTWTVSGSGGTGPEYGLITTTGVYTAPAAVPADPIVTVTATSVEDTARSGSTSVTIHASFISVEWAWISGSDTPGQAGVYGVKGLPDPSNTPGARQGSATWTDPEGNLWLFGGWGFDKDGGYCPLNDLWKFDPVTLMWTWVSGSDSALHPDVHYGTKGVSDPLNLPGGRRVAVSWIDSGGRFWLFGGQGLDATAFGTAELNDLWTFDPATLEWTWISGSDRCEQRPVYGTRGAPDPANVPGARQATVSWLGPDDSLWLFGGNGYDATSPGHSELNDLWKFDPATRMWTWVSGADTIRQPGVYGTKGVPSTSNTPGARVSPVPWTDPDGRAWLFGGYGFDRFGICSELHDLWRFDPATLEWTWMAGSDRCEGSRSMSGVYGTKGMATTANWPGTRYRGVSWTDPGGDFWLFGGTGYATPDLYTEPGGWGDLGDLWKLDMTSFIWTWVSGSDVAYPAGQYGTKGVPDPANVPGGRYEAVSWVDAAGRLWLFGGFVTYSPNPGYNLLNDLWRCDR
jgi:N-acetylneuraminic acid mutarotase